MEAKGIRFNEEHDVVVIGSGIGGLACGAMLAKSGLRVKVFEQHSIPGGYCTSFARKGFKFSAAVLFVSGCGPEGETTQILSELGLGDEIGFRRVDPVCRLLLPERAFSIPTSFDRWAENLAADFPAEAKGIRGFIDTVKAIAADMKKDPPASPLISKYDQKTLQELLADFVKDDHLKGVLSGIFFGGLPPSRFPALSWCAAMSTRITDGIYWPVGGAQVVADALAAGLRRFGGHLDLRSGVRRIVVDGGKAIGIETIDGRLVGARFVVCNSAVRQVFGGLLSHTDLAGIQPKYLGNIAALEIGISSMSVYLGIDVDPRTLGINDFLTVVHQSLDFEREWANIHQGKLAEAFFSISVPTLLDPSVAPQGQHIVHLFTFAPYYLPGGTWNRNTKAELTDLLIEKAERVMPGLSEHITVRVSATPKTNERYTLNTEGATSGWARCQANLAVRPAPKTPIQGLYLTGHWTNQGGSVRSVAASGRAVAHMILDSQ